MSESTATDGNDPTQSCYNPETSIPAPDASLDDTVSPPDKFNLFYILFPIILTGLFWQ